MTVEKEFQATYNNTTVSSNNGDVILAVPTGKGVYTTVAGNVVSANVGGATSGTVARENKPWAGYAGSAKKVGYFQVTTTGATATTVFAIACPLSSVVGVWVETVNKRVGANADGLVSFKYQAVSNNAGTVAVIGTTGGSDLETSGGNAPTVTIVADDTGDAINVVVTGVAAETWAWVGEVRYQTITSSA